MPRGVDSASVDVPDPRYVKTEDGAYIAYQVVGDGPVDIAWQFDFYGNIDCWWDGPVDQAVVRGSGVVWAVDPA